MKTFLIEKYEAYKPWKDYQVIFQKATKLIKFGPVALAVVKPEYINEIATKLKQLNIPFKGSGS